MMVHRSASWGGLLAVAVAVAAALATPAAAQLANEAAVCPLPAEGLDRYGFLRALSLDLRGRLPSLDEYAALDDADDVPTSLIDDWLASSEFQDRAVRRHRDLLWNNIDNVGLLSNNVAMRRTGELYWRRNLADDYRGDFVPCLDEPAAIDESGEIGVTELGDGTVREGYVLVRPYWDPDYEIKVCAFDAQDALVTSQGTDCATTDAYRDTECGCGPDLRWCYYGGTQTAVTRAMAVDLEMRVAANIANDESYVALFTGDRAFVNGPLVHFWRYQTGHRRGLALTPNPMPMAQLPDLEWRDADTWVEVQLGPGHSGILTSPAYLLRFQTARARANRFYSEFLCQPFVAPTGGLPAEDENTRPEPDLQQRAGCNYCHAQLEPAAAHWGRWTPNGVGYLSPLVFPRTRDDCLHCAMNGGACSTECRTYYVTRPDAPEMSPYLGQLNPYLFLREQHEDHVEEGPAGLVLERTVSGQFPDCTARRTAQWLLGRELTADEDEWVWDVTERFIDAGYSYRELVRAIVTSAPYRRVR